MKYSRRVRMFISVALALFLVINLVPPVNAFDVAKPTQNIIAAGLDHAGAIDENGTLWMWGDNTYGQLGNGGRVSTNTPVKIMDGVISVSTSGYGQGNMPRTIATAAVKSDGSLWTWGIVDSDTVIGILGSATGGNYVLETETTYGLSKIPLQTEPVKILDNVASVSMGGWNALAIQKDGTLWTWGYTGYDESGSKVPVKVMDNVVSACAGPMCAAAIKTDGSMWMWGYDFTYDYGDDNGWPLSHPLTKVMEDVAEVSIGCTGGSSGAAYFTAVKKDGSLWMWGTDWGRLGLQDQDDEEWFKNTPIKIMDSVAHVSAGVDCVAVVKTDNSLWTWGDNFCGNLGNGTLESSVIPVKVMDDVATVSAGSGFTLAVKNDGSVWSWGINSSGELGNGGKGNVTTDYGTVCQTIPSQISGLKAKTDNALQHPTSNPLEIEEEYIYDTPDPGEDTKLDAERLNRVTDPTSAAEAVRNMVNGMTQAQKNSPTGIDLATLYAETAVAKAASRSFTGEDILINSAAVADLATEAEQALTAVETALVNGGIATARYLSSTIALTTTSTSEISIRIDPDILATGVDKIRVEGPSYALTFNISELEEDLTSILTFKAEPVSTAGAALSRGNDVASLTATLLVNRTANTEPVYLANTGTNAVKVTLPGGSISNPVTVSLPKDNSKDTTYQAVVNSTGTATSSKYNPATTAVDGKVNTSGTYTVTTKEVNFTDIANKSAEMQKAIKYLASKGIISGTGGTNYSPDASISRAEIAALLVRALGKLNSSATNSFTDVKSSDWYYSAAGSSQKAGYISGFEDNTFRGTNPINKEQIVAVAARVLISDMKYKTPNNTATYLSKYSDTVASWAQPQVALATKENLVVYRTDGTFSGAKNMTRGDAAIIIYRLFQKIW